MGKLLPVWSHLGTALPSARLAIYVGAGALLWVPATVLPAWQFVPLLVLLFLGVAALMDLWLSPRPADIEVWRSTEPRMNLGVPNRITIQGRQRTRHRISLSVRDEVPGSWQIQDGQEPALRDGQLLPPLPQVQLELAPAQEAQVSYRVTPNRRGDFQLGKLTARYDTMLGFWHRQFEVEPAAEVRHVRVYPDTSEVHRFELALRQNKLQSAGLHILRLRGRGTEFESLREYTTGDEYKSINWKASARSGKLISTNYEIERDQSIIICLDCGRMMTSLALSRRQEATGSAPEEEQLPEPIPLSKLDCAINATVLLAHVANSMGDAVGLMLFSDAVLHFMPPRKGKVQTGKIIEALYNAQPGLVEPDYQAAYEYLMARKLRRSLVVTFTDIIDPEASQELLNASAALRRHHQGLCVTINNRDVIEMAQAFPRSSGQLYEKAMAERMLLQRETALEQLRARGVGVLDTDADKLTVDAVNRYLTLKSRGSL